MRPRNLFITFVFGAVFAITLVLLASCSIPPPHTTPQIPAPTDVWELQVEHVAAQVDAEALVPATPEADTSQATSVKDGLELLKTHCTQCHTTVPFDQIKKSPAEWENTLERMEAMGVSLSDAEKDTLLNYLLATGKP